jgi:hypothetical protein
MSSVIVNSDQINITVTQDVKLTIHLHVVPTLIHGA